MRPLIGFVRRFGANNSPFVVLLCCCIATFAFIAGRLTTSYAPTPRLDARMREIEKTVEEERTANEAIANNWHAEALAALVASTTEAHVEPSTTSRDAIDAIATTAAPVVHKAALRPEPLHKPVKEKKHETLSKMKPLLAALEHMSASLRYTRSVKARMELLEAYNILKGILVRRLNREQLPPPDRPHIKEKHDEKEAAQLDVCPEYWKGNKYGYPYYYTGYLIDENCTNATPFHKVLTVLIDAISKKGTRSRDLPVLLEGLEKAYPEMTAIVAINAEEIPTVMRALPRLKEQKQFQFFSPPEQERNEGQIWISLLQRVTTKYALVARGLTHFLPDARLERLVRMLSYVDADVVGGSYRNETGHWQIGCYQTAMRNYAFRLVEGYDQSYNTCVFCDYIGGPFAAKPSKLIPMIQPRMEGNALFVDLFHRLRARAPDPDAVWMAVCPDALFFTRDLNVDRTTPTDREQFLPFVRKWELSRIILPTGRTFDYACSESQLACPWNSGTTMPLCCLWELSTVLRLLLRTCLQYDIACELEGGSIVGAVKFRGILPWERDGDINWDAHDYFKMQNSTIEYARKGYTLVEETTGVPSVVDYCMGAPDLNQKNVNCGYFALRSANWRLQLYGAIYLAHSHFERLGLSHLRLKPTQILLDGEWVRTYPNPVLAARNLYGDNLFEHVEHWLALGQYSEWYTYETGHAFQRCPRPGTHNCLDQFAPDGNLQFLDVWI